MNCEDIQSQLDDFFDMQLDHDENLAISGHLHVCEICRAEAQKHELYLKTIRNLEVPEPVPGELANLLSQARKTVALKRSDNLHRMAFLKGVAATFLMVGLVVGGGRLLSPTVENQLATLTAVPTFQEVTVVINVPADLHDATLSFSLPDGLHVEGGKDIRQFSWQANLVKGVNELVMPLMIDSGLDLSTDFRIDAELGYKNQVKQFELPISISTPIEKDSWLNPIPPQTPSLNVEINA